MTRLGWKTDEPELTFKRDKFSFTREVARLRCQKEVEEKEDQKKVKRKSLKNQDIPSVAYELGVLSTLWVCRVVRSIGKSLP